MMAFLLGMNVDELLLIHIHFDFLELVDATWKSI